MTRPVDIPIIAVYSHGPGDPLSGPSTPARGSHIPPSMIRLPILALLLLSAVPSRGQGGADSLPTRTTADHGKRVIGYLTQWDAWKSTNAGMPKQGFLNHLNLDYSQYTHLNFSFFGVAEDGSLHSGD